MPVTAPKLMIIGRDGILNHFREDHVKEPEELEPIPGALEAVAQLNHAGWHVVLATNQGGIGRGLVDMASVNAVHLRLMKMLAAKGGRIDAVFFCPHAQEADCNCRKPRPGLLEEIAHRFNTELDGVPVIGDSLRDLQAATQVNAQPILVLTGKGKQTKTAGGLPPNVQIYADLDEAAKALVQ